MPSVESGDVATPCGCGFRVILHYSLRRRSAHVAAVPSEGERRRIGEVRSPRRRSVLERTMARLILVRMKFAMSEYVRLHFFASSHAMRCSAVLASFEAMPSTE